MLCLVEHHAVCLRHGVTVGREPQGVRLPVVLEVCVHGSFSLLSWIFVDKNNMLLYETAEITRFSLLESINDEDDLLRHIV